MYHVINNVLMGLNRVGSVFYDYTASVFIQSALLVILLFAIDLLLRKRVRAIFRYCVWLLVLVKLILPPMLSLPTGIGYWAGDHLPVAPGISNKAFDADAFELAGPSGEISQVRPAENIAEDDPANYRTGGSRTAPTLTWQAVLFILWLAGVLAFLAVLVQRIRFVKGLVASSCPAGDELTGLLEQCCRQMAVRRDIKLRLSEAVPSPAVCGLLRPTVLMPTSLVEKLSPEGLRATLIHELAHIKRGDLWINSVQTFLQVVYFYNPFVWFANSVIRKVCEEAVDETVLVALGGRAKDYSNTLIDIGEMVFWKADLGLRLVGVAESKKALQWRIRHMLNRPIPKSSKLGVLGIIIIFAIAAVLLPMAKAEKSKEDNKPVATENKGKSTKLLYQAAANGDIEQVRNLIAQGADVNASEGHEKWTPWTPLLAAADGGHAQVVKVLLENGAKVDAGDSLGLTPLHHAIFNEDEETVKALISGGADVNKRPNKDDDPPLFYAVWQCHAVVKALIDAGADVNAEGVQYGWTPLRHALQWAYADAARQFIGTGAKIPVVHNAVLEGNLAKVRQLVESGTDVDTKDKFGWTPTYWALSAGQKEVAEYLLNKGADVRAKTNDGCTLLHQASKAGFIEIARQLIAKGVDVNAATTEKGRQPLADAAGYGHEEIVKLLVAKGVDVNATFNRGRHPLGDAALAGHEEVVKLLIAGGADVNLHSEYRGGALHAAARYGHSTILDILIANGADVNLNAIRGTPLHRAAYGLAKVKDDTTNAEIVEKLLAKGADVDVKDPRQGRTPLHVAATLGRYRTAEVLIAAGANVNATDNEGKTPLSLAQGLGHTEIVELLHKHGATEDSAAESDNNEPSMSLYEAASAGDIEQVKMLISKGADVNAEGTRGWTPIFVATDEGHAEVVRLLLKKGANADAGDSGGNGPICYAIWNENEELVKILIAAGANINRRFSEKNPYNAFFEAIWMNNPSLVKTLIAAGADVNCKDKKGWTPLSWAISYTHADVARLFIETDVHIPELHKAVLEGDLEKVRQLVESNVNVDSPDDLGWTAAYWAASTGRTTLLEYLIAQGADVGQKPDSGRTLLHQASRAGYLDMVKLLIAEGAEINVLDEKGEAPLEMPARNGHEDVVKLLLANGANPNLGARPALHWAAYGGHPGIVNLLIAHDVDIHRLSSRKETALQLAAHSRFSFRLGEEPYAKIVKRLIAEGADIHARGGQQGGTPLHFAAFGGGARTAETLIAAGANINVRDDNGHTPLHVTTERRGRNKVPEVLIAAGAEVNAKDNEGKTPLALALEKDRTEIVELFRKHGAKE